MLTLKNITKKFNNREVLKNITINFKDNGLVFILGPSGSGKTTMLNLIGNLDKPDNGTITYQNQNIQKINENFYHNKIVSLIFQNYNLIDNFNILENLLLPLKISNQKKDIKKIKELLKSFNLKINLKTKVKNLSGGEKQRLAIIRSILMDSKIILADEPTGALDSHNSEIIIKKLKELSKEKLIIIVTHNNELAYKYADRCIKIKDGKIIKDIKCSLTCKKTKTIGNTNLYNHELNSQTILQKDTNIKHLIRKKISKIKNKTKSLSILTIIKYGLINLKTKLIRNILIIIAFSSGLSALLLVLSIKNGFNNELIELENNSLYNYPLIINNENIIGETLNNNQKYNQEKININDFSKIIKNNLDKYLINKINNLKGVEAISYYQEIDNEFQNVSYINPTNNYFELLKGRYQDNKYEILLLLDNNNAINENVKEYLSLDSLNYEDVINKKIYIDNQELTIVGIVKSNNAFFSNLNGILYQNDLFESKITSVFIFPKNNESKNQIKKELKDYYIIDESKEVVDITSTLINGISLILVLFSIISLIISVLLISILSYISVLERLKEIGVLKSLGTSKSDIRSLFTTENEIIGVVSSLISILAVYLIKLPINNYINKKIGFENLVSFDLNLIFKIIYLSIILTYISSFIPSYIASKKKISNIIK